MSGSYGIGYGLTDTSIIGMAANNLFSLNATGAHIQSAIGDLTRYGFSDHNLLANSAWNNSGGTPTSWTAELTVAGTPGTSEDNNKYTWTAVADRGWWRQTVSVAAYTTYMTSVDVVSNPDSLDRRAILALATGPAGSTLVGATAGVAAPGERITALAIIGATAGTVNVRCGIGTNANATGTVTLHKPSVTVGSELRPYYRTAGAAVAAVGGFLLPGTAGARINAGARSSVAMVRNADGTYSYAPHNIVWPSEEIVGGVGNWNKGVNLTANGLTTFSDGTPGWSFTSVGGGNSFIQANVSAPVGATISCSFLCDIASGGASYIRYNNGMGDIVESYTGTLQPSGLYLYTYTGVVPAGTLSITFHLGRVDAPAATTFIVGKPIFALGSSLPPYIPTYTASVYAPAVTHDGTAFGLQCEPAATNIFTKSDISDAGIWSPGGVGTGSAPTVTGNYALAPDGTTTAARIQLNLNGGTGALGNRSYVAFGAGCPIDGVTRTMSLFVKNNGGSSVSFLSRVNGTALLTTLAAGSNWTRVDLDSSSLADATSNIVELRGTLGTSDTADLLVWAPQLELGFVATSPILTYGTTVTRAADDPRVPLPAGLVGLIEGTLVTEGLSYGTTGYPTLAALTRSDNSYNAVQTLFDAVGGTALFEVGSGTQQASITGASVTLPVRNKVVGAFKANDFAASVNGAAVVTDTSGSVPTGLTELRLGNPYGMNYPLNGILTRIGLSTTRLTNTVIQGLSQ